MELERESPSFVKSHHFQVSSMKPVEVRSKIALPITESNRQTWRIKNLESISSLAPSFPVNIVWFRRICKSLQKPETQLQTKNEMHFHASQQRKSVASRPGPSKQIRQAWRSAPAVFAVVLNGRESSGGVTAAWGGSSPGSWQCQAAE